MWIARLQTHPSVELRCDRKLTPFKPKNFVGLLRDLVVHGYVHTVNIACCDWIVRFRVPHKKTAARGPPLACETKVVALINRRLDSGPAADKPGSTAGAVAGAADVP